MDKRLSLTYRNIDNVRVVHQFDDYLTFLKNCASDDSDVAYTWDDEVLLVVLGGVVVYSSLGKKRTLTIIEVYKWLNYTGTHMEFDEELCHSHFVKPPEARVDFND